MSKPRIRSLTLDAEKTIKGKFKPSTAAEKAFYRALKRVAEVSGQIVDAHVEGVTIRDMRAMEKALEDYAKLITPWARRQSEKLIEAVSRSNRRAYAEQSKVLGKLFRENVGAGNVGMAALALQNEQVALIRSIPIEAGMRAQKIAMEAVLSGTRAAPNEDTIAELQKQLGLTTEVAKSRAMLISRTETARANAALNQARAVAVGSTHYRWRNSDDGAVRESHKIYKGRRLDGMVFEWSKPPRLDDGTVGHPGSFPNCRCYAEPVLED